MLRASYRGPIKFYMSISHRPITIIRGDNLKSISLYSKKNNLLAFIIKLILKDEDLIPLKKNADAKFRSFDNTSLVKSRNIPFSFPVLH